MTTSSVTIIKADPGKILHKGDVYASSVMLKENEDGSDWEEIDISSMPAVEDDI